MFLEKNVDGNHYIDSYTDKTGCKIQIFFAENANEKIPKMITDNLIDTFEKRMKETEEIEFAH